MKWDYGHSSCCWCVKCLFYVAPSAPSTLCSTRTMLPGNTCNNTVGSRVHPSKWETKHSRHIPHSLQCSVSCNILMTQPCQLSYFSVILVTCQSAKGREHLFTRSMFYFVWFHAHLGSFRNKVNTQVQFVLFGNFLCFLTCTTMARC